MLIQIIPTDCIDDRIFKIITSYNNTIYSSSTGLKPIDFITKDLDRNDVGEIRRKLEFEKIKPIKKLNSNKNGQNDLSDNIVQNRKIAKISPKYRKLNQRHKEG